MSIQKSIHARIQSTNTWIHTNRKHIQNVHAYLYMPVCLCMSYLRVCVCARVRARGAHTHTATNVHVRINVHVFAHMYMRININIHVCIRARAHGAHTQTEINGQGQLLPFVGERKIGKHPPRWSDLHWNPLCTVAPDSLSVSAMWVVCVWCVRV